MANLTPGYNLGLTPTQLKQMLGGQGGQEITAYLPDPSKYTGVAGSEYAPGSAPNLQYVADTIFKQYKDASGNLFELTPSNNPAGLSDPGTYLKQISGAPQGYAQTPQELLSSFKNFTPLGTGSIYDNVSQNQSKDILPGETEQAYYKRTGVGYSPAFGGQMPAPIVPTRQSIQNDLNNILKGLGGTSNPQTGQMNITAEQLSKATGTPLQVPPSTTTGTTTANDNAAAAVAGVTGNKSFADFYKDFTPPETTTDKLLQDLVNKQISEIDDLKGQGEYQLAQEKAQEVEAKKQAMKLNQGKIDALNAEFEKYSLDEQGKPITLASIQGAVLAKRNAIAGQMLMLQAAQLSLTGNYNDAIEAANHATELHFADAKATVEARKAQIDLIKDQVTTQQKRYTDAMTAYLNSVEKQISIQEANAKDLNAEKINIMSKYGTGTDMQMTDSLSTLIQKKLESAVYKKEIQASGATPAENKEFTRVKAIVASHPNEWGHAADQIDAEFGKGTATKYDDYLKGVYQKGTSNNGALDFSNL